MSNLRELPSVDLILQTPRAQDWLISYGRSLTIEAIRASLEEARNCYGKKASLPKREDLMETIELRLRSWTAPTLQAVINATGVILHTNLGRAPLSQAAIQAMQVAASSYSTLEYDLTKGGRGSRSMHAEALVQRLSGAQAAMVVNNNAAAVLLALSALAKRRAAVIARSQLVEIGGGFRVPEVMKQSGARLVEIGTTNRVHISDYEAALEESPALILRAHRSNFQILGFTSEPDLAEITALAHRASIPVVDDLGSGAFLDTARFGMGHEPTVQESVKAGADLVCFSGDKLLGGPQAGIILGRSDLIEKLKRHPLARAIRADKICLAALSATLLHYVKEEAELQIPIWRMIATTVDQAQARAKAWAQASGRGEVISGLSTVGGGSLPGETLPTFLLALNARRPNAALSDLRQANPPVIARLENDQVLLDPRTVLPEQDSVLVSILKHVFSE
jgi:L-seryl-tRNA(Ser) seleniumtransferase